MQTANVTLSPDQYLAGWKPDDGVLFVPAFSETRAGDRVAVRVGLNGHDLRATLFGTVTVVRRLGRPTLPPGAELRLDPDSKRAAGWIAASARGEEVTFRTRAPRFLAEQRLVASNRRLSVPVLTSNISSLGAALRWRGPLPAVGELVTLKLGEGLLAATPEAVVAWVVPSPRGPAQVGVRVLTTGRGARAWAKMATAAQRSGALKL